MSVLLIPGRRSGIINHDNLNKDCVCPIQNINTKQIKNSNPDVIPISTQTSRAVNAIKHTHGGRVVFGNNYPYNNYTTNNTLMYRPPIKNKF